VAGGSTYIGGKMLAKMGRIALLAEELGRRAEGVAMAARLADVLEVWLDAGRAASPLLYDPLWGGAVACGCYYDEENEGCYNAVSGTDCPGLYDLGQNFGQGFYQDHHFHFGYHIYAGECGADRSVNQPTNQSINQSNSSSPGFSLPFPMLV
jgi:endo-1,3(4)-beta-glucanase